MFYGSAEECDMDFTSFVTLFKSIFLEGFARPVGGVRTIIKALVRKYRSCGGVIRMNCGVKRLESDNGRVIGVTLESGETLSARQVFSSAGYRETMRLCADTAFSRESRNNDVGRISFVESIFVLGKTPSSLGHNATIVFFNDSERFTYAAPHELVDSSSGILCTPNNYENHEEMGEGVVRLTWLASFDRWTGLQETDYTAAKQRLHGRMADRVRQYIPALSDHLVFSDMFTPRTIHHYTGHLNGAVYGSPRKRRDGRTPFENLFICGTDQGYLGIVGAMLSGITMANKHVLEK
jgi:phytoene dehydrogenase-like protein